MSEVAIRAALEKRLRAISAPTVTAWPTSFENTAFTEPSNKQYQRAFVLFSTTRAAGFGKNATEYWAGTFQVNVHIAGNSGTGAAGQRAAVIRAQFSRGTALSDSGSTVKVTCETPYVGSAIEGDDAYMLPVIIPWFCYIQP